jgi:hypothetical protein
LPLRLRMRAQGLRSRPLLPLLKARPSRGLLLRVRLPPPPPVPLRSLEETRRSKQRCGGSVDSALTSLPVLTMMAATATAARSPVTW